MIYLKGIFDPPAARYTILNFISIERALFKKILSVKSQPQKECPRVKEEVKIAEEETEDAALFALIIVSGNQASKKQADLRAKKRDSLF